MIRSILSKVRQGLERTRDAVLGGLRSALLGRRVDEAMLDDVERRLIAADVGVQAARRLSDSLRADFKSGSLTRGEDVIEHLKRQLKALWPDEARALALAANGPTVIMVTGINGAGKTTSIAKLCRTLRTQGKSVLLAACDTFRAGAVRQLEIWGDRLGVEVVKGQQGGDPAAVAFDAAQAALSRRIDVLIVDTAGRLQTQEPLMRQLSKIKSVLAKKIPGAPHEVLLVLDATTGQNALRQAQEFSKSAGVTGIFLAKLDGTAKGGIVVAIRQATEIPVKFVGLGETPDDVQPFDPETFVEAMLGEA